MKLSIKICASIQRYPSRVIIIRVSLNSLKVGYKLPSKIIGALTFKFNLEEGNSEGIRDCKNFLGV